MATEGKKIQDLILSGQDDAVLKRMYIQVYPKIGSYIRKNRGSLQEAEDMFQDCIVQIYSMAVEHKLENIANVGGFMMQMAKNRWINQSKRMAREMVMESLPENPEENDLVVQLLNEEKSRTIQWMMDQIGDRCKELLLMSVFQKFSMEEIAQKMAFSSANAAKTQNYRCKEKLIELLEKNPSLKTELRG